MTLKLKLHREAPFESQAGSHMRFPVHAVRSMPAPSSGQPKGGRGMEQDANVMRHPELIRQIEATLDRMQAGLDQLQEHVKSNYKFPGYQDEERPRAA